MQFDLRSGPNFVTRGRLAAIIAEGVRRGLIQQERYPATRTGDDVVRHTLSPGVSVTVVPTRRAQEAA